MVGSKILHYKILEKLGEGGMGVVYLAEDTKLKRKVAIKFLPRSLSINEEEKKRFEIEAQAAASLNHPNIAQIYSIEETGEEIFIVMEYIEGKELKEIIERKDVGAENIQPLQREDLIDYAIQIAEGLKSAHKKGIIHRDIKSSNIMITDDGKVKIMDFGLAKVGKGSQLTKIGTIFGTTSYMSPEQARGEEADKRTDIWSFGVVLYEMLNGELPFKGDYEQAIIYSILNNEPEPKKKYLAADSKLTQIVKRCLKKVPEDRYLSMNDIIQELHGIHRTELKETKELEKSIAVLYFENMTSEKENEYFCAGITEDIIIDLSKISKLKVIPRSDVLPFKSKEINSAKVGEILGVSHILEGSVRIAGGRIRVTAQLIDLQSGFPIWAERYDRLLEDIFEVQIELSQKIAEALKVSLSDSEKELLAKKPTDDLRAYDFYMRGRDYLNTGGKINNESAIKMFERAIAIDPNYSLAYLALSEAYTFQYIYYDGKQKWLGMIISASEKAKELDPSLLEVEVTKGVVLYHQKRFEEAKRTIRKFIEKKDDYYPAYFWLGVNEEITKEYNAAIKHFIRAKDIKPYSEEPLVHIEMIYRRMGDLDASKAAAEKVIEVANKKIEANARDGVALSRVAANYAILGNNTKALEILKKVLENSPNDGLALYNCACTYAQLGKKNEAYEHLKKAISVGYKNIIEWIENDPDFKSFQDDPEFREILSGN